MPGNSPPVVPADVPLARGCQCEKPICFTEDDGYCCQCGRLHEPPPVASTKRLARAIGRIAAGP